MRTKRISNSPAAHKRNRSANSVLRWIPRWGSDSSSLARPRSKRPPHKRSSSPSAVAMAKRSRNCAGMCTRVLDGSASILASQSLGSSGGCDPLGAAMPAPAGARLAAWLGKLTLSSALAGRAGSAAAQCGHSRDHTDRSPQQWGHSPRPSPVRTLAPISTQTLSDVLRGKVAHQATSCAAAAVGWAKWAAKNWTWWGRWRRQCWGKELRGRPLPWPRWLRRLVCTRTSPLRGALVAERACYHPAHAA